MLIVAPLDIVLTIAAIISLGKTAKSFQEAANEFKTELKKEMEEDVKSGNDISTGSDGGAAGGDGSENV